MQVQLHAEHSWRGCDEPVPDCSVCTLVQQCLHAGGHCGFSAGQHLPHGGLHGDAATSWGMHHCLQTLAQTEQLSICIAVACSVTRFALIGLLASGVRLKVCQHNLRHVQVRYVVM